MEAAVVKLTRKEFVDCYELRNAMETKGDYDRREFEDLWTQFFRERCDGQNTIGLVSEDQLSDEMPSAQKEFLELALNILQAGGHEEEYEFLVKFWW